MFTPTQPLATTVAAFEKVTESLLEDCSSLVWIADLTDFPPTSSSAFVRLMTARAYKGDSTTGFQSPATDYIEGVPDLAELLELRRPQRFAVRVRGEGLRARGIYGGDILVVNSDAEPVSGKVCVAFVLGDVVLAILSERDGEWWLEPSDQPAQPVSDDTEVWAMISALVRTNV